MAGSEFRNNDVASSSSLSEAQQYELIVRDILAAWISRFDGRPETIMVRQRVPGASGQAHEVDLSFEIEVGGARLLFMVECKCYTRKVGVDDLAEFAYKLRDIGANKGIVVATSEFAPGAIKVATREHIALVNVFAREGEWVERVVRGRNSGSSGTSRQWIEKFLPLGQSSGQGELGYCDESGSLISQIATWMQAMALDQEQQELSTSSHKERGTDQGDSNS